MLSLKVCLQKGNEKSSPEFEDEGDKCAHTNWRKRRANNDKNEDTCNLIITPSFISII